MITTRTGDVAPSSCDGSPAGSGGAPYRGATAEEGGSAVATREEILAQTFLQLADDFDDFDDFDVIDLLTMLSSRCVEPLDASATGILLVDVHGTRTSSRRRAKRRTCWSCSKSKPGRPLP